MTSEPRFETIAGLPVMVLPATGPTLGLHDAVDLVGQAFGMWATVVVVPVDRFDDSFWDLSTRVAGEFVQKFVNYRLTLVFVGDLAERAPAGSALAAFIAESNRGRHVRFLTDLENTDQALAGLAA